MIRRLSDKSCNQSLSRQICIALSFGPAYGQESANQTHGRMCLDSSSSRKPLLLHSCSFLMVFGKHNLHHIYLSLSMHMPRRNSWFPLPVSAYVMTHDSHSLSSTHPHERQVATKYAPCVATHVSHAAYSVQSGCQILKNDILFFSPVRRRRTSINTYH